MSCTRPATVDPRDDARDAMRAASAFGVRVRNALRQAIPHDPDFFGDLTVTIRGGKIRVDVKFQSRDENWTDSSQGGR